MKRITTLLLLLSTAACGGAANIGPSPLPTTAQPSIPPPPPVVASVRDVMLGERVEGVFGDGLTIRPDEHHFLVTVPNEGTLEVSLHWNPVELGTLLLLKLEDRTFMPFRPDWSPVVGRIHVEAGKRYLIVVGLAGADWLPEDPFVLTSRLEP